MPLDDGPTPERVLRAEGFFTDIGYRSRRRVSMCDDALGRAWMRSKISDEEYAGLRRYRLHWLAGGLQGHLGSVDLNRIYAHDPASMSGLAKTEKQQDHRDCYRAAQSSLGTRPAFVADQIACCGSSLSDVGIMLGYRSLARGREKAREILSDAGYRLAMFFRNR